jgi:hypothetical protein
VILLCLSSGIGAQYLNKYSYINPEIEYFYQYSWLDKVVNPPLYKFQWLFIELFKIIVSPEHRNAELILGQWKSSKTVFDNSVFEESRIQPTFYQNTYLNYFVNFCKKERIKLVIVEMPASIKNRNLAQNKFIGNSYSNNFNVINLNNKQLADSLFSAKTDWLAPDHLNQIGAEKLTSYIFNVVLKGEYSNFDN